MRAIKIILRILAGLFAVIIIAIVALMLTFTASELNVARIDVGDLPPASPPAGMSISALPTGSIESKAALAFRGGAWNDIRQFSMTALLVRHPKGNLLIDTGFGKNVDDHVRSLPALLQKTTTYTKDTPVAAQLAGGGMTPGDLAGVILTHAHWDHVSGLDDLGNVPVMVDAAEKGFIDAKTQNTELLNSFNNINYKQYEFEGGPYLGFPSSHDVWGDGSVVIVPAPGHTPGSVVVFVNLPSGTRYAALGDMVWQMEGIELPAEKPWLLRRLIGEDDDQVHKDIAIMRSISKKYPQIHLLPAHDPSAFRMIPVFPQSAN